MVDTIPVNLNGDGVRLMYLMSTSFQTKQYILFSFSKTLGLGEGSFCNNEKLNFSRIDEENFKEIIRLQQLKVNYDHIQSFFKSEIPVIPNELDKWLESNDLSQAFELEKKKRRINLDKIVNSNLVAAWPEWMILELKQDVCRELYLAENHQILILNKSS